MLKDRIFYVVVAVALLVTAILVINQSTATAKLAAEISGQTAASPVQAVNAACSFSRQDVQSLRLVQVKQMGIWLPRTAIGYTGPDGGATSLLNCRFDNR